MGIVRGNHPAKVDPKGRLPLPAGVREFFASGEKVQVFITTTDGQSAEIWPLEKWEEREAKLGKLGLDPEAEDYLYMANYYGKEVQIDGQGRVMLPQLLREEARLTGDVAILGNPNFLAVFNDQLFRETRLRPLTREQKFSIAQKLESA
jgi:MraZ protein